jgi:hypothetical protein
VCTALPSITATIKCEQDTLYVKQTNSHVRTHSPLRNMSSVFLCSSSTEMLGERGEGTSQYVMDSNMAAQWLMCECLVEAGCWYRDSQFDKS